MQAAFYKATRPGLQGIYSRAVRWIDRGPYSHCELVVDGVAYSSSLMDGGVRGKVIQFKPEHWDFIDLPWADAQRVLDMLAAFYEPLIAADEPAVALQAA